MYKQLWLEGCSQIKEKEETSHTVEVEMRMFKILIK